MIVDWHLPLLLLLQVNVPDDPLPSQAKFDVCRVGLQAMIQTSERVVDEKKKKTRQRVEAIKRLRKRAKDAVLADPKLELEQTQTLVAAAPEESFKLTMQEAASQPDGDDEQDEVEAELGGKRLFGRKKKSKKNDMGGEQEVPRAAVAMAEAALAGKLLDELKALAGDSGGIARSGTGGGGMGTGTIDMSGMNGATTAGAVEGRPSAGIELAASTTGNFDANSCIGQLCAACESQTSVVELLQEMMTEPWRLLEKAVAKCGTDLGTVLSKRRTEEVVEEEDVSVGMDARTEKHVFVDTDKNKQRVAPKSVMPVKKHIILEAVTSDAWGRVMQGRHAQQHDGEVLTSLQQTMAVEQRRQGKLHTQFKAVDSRKGVSLASINVSRSFGVGKIRTTKKQPSWAKMTLPPSPVTARYKAKASGQLSTRRTFGVKAPKEGAGRPPPPDAVVHGALTTSYSQGAWKPSEWQLRPQTR
jgi:hypothetical protein